MLARPELLSSLPTGREQDRLSSLIGKCLLGCAMFEQHDNTALCDKFCDPNQTRTVAASEG